MRKIMTIAGTRPEVIRLTNIIKKLDTFTDHVFVHTGQNFTFHLHEQFFKDLDLRLPDYQLNQGQLVGMDYISMLLREMEPIFDKEQPDAVLILGDTNSALSAFNAKKRGIPVFHMEAGNRCFSDKVPEEINRKIIDSLSEILMPYTQRSREYLMREGYHPSKIIVTGNPIAEVIHTYLPQAKKPPFEGDYALVTLHRNENVADPVILKQIIAALNTIAKEMTVILSIHPKLESMLKANKIDLHANIKGSPPFSFTEFLGLEKGAKVILSDSGTVPEECAILGVPCVLMRDSTERPELLEINANIVSGVQTEDILGAYRAATQLPVGRIPDDYRDLDVSDKVVKTLLRYL